MGLGYIVGLKYAAIICAGSFVSWYLLIPVVSYIGADLTVPLGTGVTKLINQMSAEEIFRNYIRHVGIGGIAMAGIIGIIRSSKIIKGAVSMGFKELFHKKTADDVHVNTSVWPWLMRCALTMIRLAAAWRNTSVSRTTGTACRIDDVGEDLSGTHRWELIDVAHQQQRGALAEWL